MSSELWFITLVATVWAITVGTLVSWLVYRWWPRKVKKGSTWNTNDRPSTD